MFKHKYSFLSSHFISGSIKNFGELSKLAPEYSTMLKNETKNGVEVVVGKLKTKLSDVENLNKFC